MSADQVTGQRVCQRPKGTGQRSVIGHKSEPQIRGWQWDVRRHGRTPMLHRRRSRAETPRYTCVLCSTLTGRSRDGGGGRGGAGRPPVGWPQLKVVIHRLGAPPPHPLPQWVDGVTQTIHKQAPKQTTRTRRDRHRSLNITRTI